MTTIIVCPLRLVKQIVANRSPSHLITLLDPDDRIETPAGIEPERFRKLIDFALGKDSAFTNQLAANP